MIMLSEIIGTGDIISFGKMFSGAFLPSVLIIIFSLFILGVSLKGGGPGVIGGGTSLFVFSLFITNLIFGFGPGTTKKEGDDSKNHFFSTYYSDKNQTFFISCEEVRKIFVEEKGRWEYNEEKDEKYLYPEKGYRIIDKEGKSYAIGYIYLDSYYSSLNVPRKFGGYGISQQLINPWSLSYMFFIGVIGWGLGLVILILS